MSRRAIVTCNVYPPIPDRQFDWCAYFDGEEERGHYGYGRTEQSAITDLTENYDEYDINPAIAGQAGEQS